MTKSRPFRGRFSTCADVIGTLTSVFASPDEVDVAGEAQAAEATAYPAEVRNGDSLVPVTAGERVSERQALEALLLPSADNMAWILARWDAGSQAGFVARMNTAARTLGMTATRYTDPSGLDATTVSTSAHLPWAPSAGHAIAST